jgi:succinate dehydrogenase / fumarate reductase iron-sulfur subunit
MQITLKVWRQSGPSKPGQFKTYQVKANPHMSFLEMFDVLNESLTEKGEDPVAFDHDCREGVCGMCSMVINGRPHGPMNATTTCQLHMRSFRDGDEIVVEPFRAHAFPVIKDLAVDRSSFDRIQQAGGYISVNTGSAPDANAIPVGKDDAEAAFDYAQCIGCGACVAACPNASAMLFLGARVAHMQLLPQGRVEQPTRVRNMVAAMEAEGFGGCTNHGECSAACPKQISLDGISVLNSQFLRQAALPR